MTFLFIIDIIYTNIFLHGIMLSQECFWFYYYLNSVVMYISYYGLSSFKIVAKSDGRGSEDVVILFSPFSKKVGLNPPQTNADIVLISLDDMKFNNTDYVRNNPIIVETAGEYSIKGVSIIGFEVSADYNNGKIRGNTVVYILDVEKIKIVYLGAIGSDLTPDQLEQVMEADILFLPIGDKMGLDGRTAEVIARKIDPKIIIPMHYNVGKLKLDDLRDSSDFCSNIGNCPNNSIEKILINEKELENRKMEVVSLSLV